MTVRLNNFRSTHGDRKAVGFAALLASCLAFGSLAGACGDTSGSGDLLGGGGDTSNAATGGPGGGPGGSSTGNPGLSTDGGIVGEGGGTAPALAEKLFRDLQPDLVKTCGGSACHEGSTSAPTWLAPPDPYVSIKKYDASQSGDKKFIVPDSLSSRLFTKGPHTGPAMPPPDGTGNLGDKVKKWLDVEAAALTSSKLPATTPVALATGANTIDISTAGTGIAGAKITFNASITSGLVMLTQVKLVAGPASGVHIVHPIFVQVSADPKTAPLEDPADSGSNIDDTAGAGKTISVGPGTFILTGFKWQATDMMQIEFAKVEPGTVTAGDAGAGGGGCKNVNGFQSIAGIFQGQNINPNCTAACHKTGGGGDGALDLNALTLNPPDYATACAQALTKVDLANKAQSPLILHPTGQMGNHAGGTVSDVQGFTNNIMTWLSGE